MEKGANNEIIQGVKILDYIGLFGPLILMVFSFLLLLNKPLLLCVYVIGSGTNIVANLILKNMFKDPRPKEDILLLDLGLTKDKRAPLDRYGMPSGHAQSVGFSCSFIYFTLRNTSYLWFFFTYLLVSIITMFQRYKYKNHTFFQIVIGFIIGLFIGVTFAYFGKYYTKGSLKMKADDNCFILNGFCA